MLIATLAYNILLSVVYALNTYCLGYVASLPFIKHLNSDLLKFIVRWALGWNVLISLVHIFGVFSWLNPITYAGLLTLGIGLYIIVKIKKLPFLASKVKFLLKNCLGKIKFTFHENKFLSGALLVFVLLLFIIALAPVSKTDELNYYYYFVKRIAVNGAILFDYYPVLSFQPMAQQLWYVPVYGLSAHEAPALLNVFTSFLILFIAYSWLTKYIERKYALLAAVAIYVNLNAVSIYPAPQDNVAAWLWGLVSLILTYEFLYSGNGRQNLNINLLILGLIYSTAYLAKLTNLPLIFFCVLVIAIALIKNKWGWQKIVYLIIPSVIFITQFLIKTYLWTGNPLFPTMLNLFGSTTFDVAAVKVYIANLARVWPVGILATLKALWDELVYNLKWNASPLLILLSPFGWFYLLKAKKILLFAIPIAFIITMTLMGGSHRLSSGVLMFSVLALFIHGKKIIQNKYVSGLIKLHIALLVIISSIYSFQFGKYVFGFENKQEFFKYKVQTYEEIQWANNNLPKGTKILTGTWEQYNFNFQTYCLNEYPLVIGVDAKKLQSTDDIYSFLKSKKITHLFLTKIADRPSQIFEDELYQVGNKYGKLIYEHDNATIRGFRYPTKKPILGGVSIYELH